MNISEVFAIEQTNESKPQAIEPKKEERRRKHKKRHHIKKETRRNGSSSSNHGYSVGSDHSHSHAAVGIDSCGGGDADAGVDTGDGVDTDTGASTSAGASTDTDAVVTFTVCDIVSLKSASSQGSESTSSTLSARSSLSGQKKRGKKNDRRFVRFNVNVKVKIIPPLDEDIRYKAWYTRSDFKSIARAVSHTTRLMNDGIILDSMGGTQCTRGLEHKTMDGSRRRESCKGNSIRTVLYEQRRQQLLPPEMERSMKKLALLYKESTKPAVAEALALAEKDHEDVLRIIHLDNTEEKIINTSRDRHHGYKEGMKKKLKQLFLRTSRSSAAA